MSEAIAKYYKHFSSAPIKNKSPLYNQELYNLYKLPKTEGRKQQAHFNITEPNAIYQADLLFLPNDDGFKYALVVVDPATGKTDAEPLKEKTADAVLKAFKKIFQRKILKIPSVQIQCDNGSEFHGVVEKYFDEKGIGIRYAKTGRSRQTAYAEARNKTIGKAIHQRQTAEQLLTGEIARNWIDDLPNFIKAINEHVVTVPKNKLSRNPIIDEDDPILQIGTLVRVALDKPIESTGKRLSGKFRASDIRFDPDKEKILNVIISPDEPILYKVSGQNNLGVAYTYNQLQVVDENEQEPPSTVIRGKPNQYIIKKILDKKKEKGRIYYKVQWRGFNGTTDATWEPISTFGSIKLKV